MKPVLRLDLSGPSGNVYFVIGYASQLLTGMMLEHFKEAIDAATQPGAGKSYKDILAIVHTYVMLVDTSGMYAEYAEPKP